MDNSNTYMKNLLNEVQKELPHIKIELFFQGVIEKIDKDIVFTKLYDQFEQEDLLAEISYDSFPKDNLYPQLESGHIFYLYVGQNKITRENFKLIRMSREVWTQEQIDKINLLSQELLKKLKIE